MNRFEIRVSLATFAVSVVALAMLWGYLTTSSLYHKPGIGKGPYNTVAPDKAQP